MLNQAPLISLTVDSAFSSGGNRLCFVHPEDELCCLKLARPERTPDKKRAEKSFPGNLRGLTYFDENAADIAVYKHFDKVIGQDAYQLVPKCYGYIETNLGKALAFEMIKDSDNKISLTLKQYVWLYGWTETLRDAVNRFLPVWQSLGMPSRNLLLHNIVVQQTYQENSSTIERLVVIDGLGWPDIITFAHFIGPIARWKAKRKSQRLISAIDNLIEKKTSGGDWGIRGWLDDEQRQ